MKPGEILNLSALLSDRSRLSIMAYLAAAKEPQSFTQLLAALEFSKGNLSSHLRRLEEARLVEVKKEFVERKPLSSYRCSELGRQEMQRYLQGIEQVLRGVLGEERGEVQK
jgi:DNA-binding transcriptional ArsR family regulator